MLRIVFYYVGQKKEYFCFLNDLIEFSSGLMSNNKGKAKFRQTISTLKPSINYFNKLYHNSCPYKLFFSLKRAVIPKSKMCKIINFFTVIIFLLSTLSVTEMLNYRK